MYTREEKKVRSVYRRCVSASAYRNRIAWEVYKLVEILYGFAVSAIATYEYLWSVHTYEAKLTTTKRTEPNNNINCEANGNDDDNDEKKNR